MEAVIFPYIRKEAERIKESIMVLWINILWNNNFVNPMGLLLLHEKTGALAMAEPGLMAGRQQAGH